MRMNKLDYRDRTGDKLVIKFPSTIIHLLINENMNTKYIIPTSVTHLTLNNYDTYDLNIPLSVTHLNHMYRNYLMLNELLM